MEPNQSQATPCGQYPASGCSKSESDTPIVDAWMCSGNGWGSLIDLAQFIERERNILFAAITKAVARFDKLSWGWDGDCGTGNIMRELEEARDKVCTLNPGIDARQADHTTKEAR